MERDELEGGAERTPAVRTEETTTTTYSAGHGTAPDLAPAARGAVRPRAGGGEDEAARIERERTAPGSVRAEDTEPYIGLQYIARLFKIVSFMVIFALVLEVVLGVASDGAGAILPLFAEIVQNGVLAAILWGAADIVLLLIDLGHDVRASRVLLGRVSARGEQQYGGQRQRERER